MISEEILHLLQLHLVVLRVVRHEEGVSGDGFQRDLTLKVCLHLARKTSPKLMFPVLATLVDAKYLSGGSLLEYALGAIPTPPPLRAALVLPALTVGTLGDEMPMLLECRRGVRHYELLYGVVQVPLHPSTVHHHHLHALPCFCMYHRVDVSGHERVDGSDGASVAIWLRLRCGKGGHVGQSPCDSVEGPT